MLPLVKTPVKKIEKYEGIVSKSILSAVENNAKKLQGLKVAMVNATPRGGGVAEILKSLIPLMKGVGIKAEWYTIPPEGEFFRITKEIHNALQGKEYGFPFWDKARYLKHMEKTYSLMKDMKPDIWVIHDPQPCGVISYLPRSQPLISHIHIDLTSPNKKTWKFISGFLKAYDKVVFSSKEFVQKEVKDKAKVFTPAIDPLMEKNRPMNPKKAELILKSFGIDTNKPLISQVSRFDPWKDPLGVIEAYRLAKKKIPDLQLAMVGLFLAHDDPEAIEIFKEVQKAAKGEPDIFLFSEPDRIGSLKVDTFVSAFQTGSDVILQNSIREGFGLSLSESMWKGKGTIARKAGGLKIQIENKKNGFLISNPREASKKIDLLIKNPRLSEKLGKAAKKQVREKFLMPRLLRDYLRLFKKTL